MDDVGSSDKLKNTCVLWFFHCDGAIRPIRTLEAATVRITDMQMECGKHGEEVAVRDRHNKGGEGRAGYPDGEVTTR